MKKLFFSLIIFILILTPVAISASYSLQVDYPAISGFDPGMGLVEYIRYIYLFALGTVGLAAFGVMVYGGILYMMSGANPSLQGEAKKWFQGAISGLVLTLASYLILNTINPALVRIQAPTLPDAEIPTYTLQENDPCIPWTRPFCGPGLACKDQKIIGEDYKCEFSIEESTPAPTTPTQPTTYKCTYECPTFGPIMIQASSSNSPDCDSCAEYALNKCNEDCDVDCFLSRPCVPNIAPALTP